MLGRFCWHDDGVQRCPVSLQGLSAARPVNVTVDKSYEETSTHLKLSASQTAGKFLRWINQVRSLAVGSALSVPAFTTDFFLSRRGLVAPTASEIADVLRDEGYNVTVQDYDFRLGASSVEATHDAIKAAGDLVVLFTADYEKSPFTRKEFTSFEADRAQSSDGALLRDLGDLVSARPLLERAVAAGRRRHGNGPRGVESPASAARRSCSGSTIIGTCAQRLLLRTANIEDGLSLAQVALAAHDECLGGDHGWTKDSASVVAGALEALNRSEEASGLRAR
jgi:TIR domain